MSKQVIKPAMVKDENDALTRIEVWMRKKGYKGIFVALNRYGLDDGKWKFDFSNPLGPFSINAETGEVYDGNDYFSLDNVEKHGVDCGCAYCSATIADMAWVEDVHRDNAGLRIIELTSGNKFYIEYVGAQYVRGPKRSGVEDFDDDHVGIYFFDPAEVMKKI